MPTMGQGRIIVWEGASLWMLEGTRQTANIQPHAHHAIQLTFLLSGAFTLEAQGKSWSAPIVAVRSDARHTFRASGAAAFLFIEPESPAGRALTDRLFAHEPIAALESADAMTALEDLRLCFAAGGKEEEMLRVGRNIIATIPPRACLGEGDRRTQSGGGGVPAPPDPRIQKMIAYATKNLEDRITLASAAAHINLSPGRARHLFVAQTGLAFKSYILWLRLERAVSLYAAGRSLTEAAHEAGFADSAHLSRTFRRTFGLAAAELRLES